jgi:iron(III) transport system permease protein
MTSQLFRLIIIGCAALVAAPLFVLVYSLTYAISPTLEHMAATLLPEAVTNTLFLMAMVGIGTTVIGVSTAWLVTRYAFSGSRMLDVLLLLPLAMPAYIIGYAYTDALGFTGPLQSALRQIFGWNRADYGFPDVHSLGGAGFMLTLVLYPYVFLLARTAFLDQSAQCLDAARVAGASRWRMFGTVALPLARPAIIAGVSLALMETIADFGTVQYFGVNTFTTLIYRSWYGMGDRIAAMQLATGLLALVMLLIGLEHLSRRQRRFSTGARGQRRSTPIRLIGRQALLAQIICATPVLFGFAIPVVILTMLHIHGGDPFFSGRFMGYAANSFMLATTAAILVVSLSFIAACTARLAPSVAVRRAISLMNTGYAIPGTVIAVAILYPLGLLDRVLSITLLSWTGRNYGLLLSGTVTALLFAYLVRFFAVAHNGIEAGFQKIPTTIDDVARVLGTRPSGVITHIHAPLIRRPLLMAGLMVFVDVLKELPATLIIRPFNFDTLAVRVYQLASDERLEQAATGALMIVLVGLLPVLLLMQASRQNTGNLQQNTLPRLLSSARLDKQPSPS